MRLSANTLCALSICTLALWLCPALTVLSDTLDPLRDQQRVVIDQSNAVNKATASWTFLGQRDRHAYMRNRFDKTMKRVVLDFSGVIGLVAGGQSKNIQQAMVSANQQKKYTRGIASWNMRIDPDYQVSFRLMTTYGKRQLTYTASENRFVTTDKNIIRYGLGQASAQGQWAKITRDLSADLQRKEPSNRVIAVNYMMIKGTGSVAGVRVRFVPDQPLHANALTESNSALHAQSAAASVTENLSVAPKPQKYPAANAIAVTRPFQSKVPVRYEPFAPRSIQLESSASTSALNIVVDGKLDEATWSSAYVANDFRVSKNRLPSSDKTEVLVLSDSNNLYFAFKNFDSRPELVSAIETLRDAGTGTDDAVSVQIDPYQNYTAATTYSVNALGTKNDQRATGGTQKVQWKGDWQGAAIRTDYGWSAEMAIPFNILNFDAAADAFGVNFSRYQNRTSEESHWAEPASTKAREPKGRLTGLQLPKNKTERIWTFMPYLVAGRNTYDREGTMQEQSVHGGVTVKYEPKNNFTALLEVKPDFSQIESQISDIDFSYTEKETADTRTFFQEGSAYFGDDSQYFYSQRISDFDAGVKTFLQDGKNIIGALVVTAPDDHNYAFARYRRNLSNNAGLTVTAVGSDIADNRSQLVAAGMDARFKSGLFYDVKGSITDDELSTDEDPGRSANLLVGWSPGSWEIGVKSDYYDTTYRPTTALIGDDLPGTKSTGTYLSIYNEGHSYIKNINANVEYSHRLTHENEVQNEGVYTSADFELFSKSRIKVSYSNYDYRPLADAPGVFSSTSNQDRYWTANFDFNIYSSKYGYGLYAADGQLAGGDYRYLSGYAWFNPTNSTNLKVSREELESFGIYKQYSISGGWDISHRDGVVGRFSSGTGYEQWRLAYRRKVSSGMDVFLAMQRQTDTKDQFTGKLVWTFQ